MKGTARTWLIAIVGASFIVRMVVAWLRATPVLFPDEYIYSALGRSLAESGHPTIRGGGAHFPALLQPILTAPVWLIHDVGLAYRVLQGMSAFAMSLAAVPAYLLARRLGLSQRIGLAVAALAVLVPDVVYASYVSAEAFAYPLVLAAVLAGTAALVSPTRRAQLAFVGFAGLAIFARVQFVILPVVFVLAVIIVGLVERRFRAAVREQVLPLALFLLPVTVMLALGPGRSMGYYHGAFGLRPEVLPFFRWVASDAMALAYAAGWVIVPGALLGVFFAIRRPSSRDELAFAVFGALLAVALLCQAGVYQANPEALHGTVSAVNGIKERYLFYVVPLIGLAFALYARRGWPAWMWHLALAAILVIVSVRVPLSGYATATTVNASPILYGVYWLSERIGDTGAASFAVAAAAAVLAVVAVGASRRPRLGTPVVLACALLASATASAGAVAFTVRVTGEAKRALLPADPSFVDRTGLRDVALLQTPGGLRSATFQMLFWNRSVDRILQLPNAPAVDAFKAEDAELGEDGSVLVGGSAFRGPLLIDGYASYARLRGAHAVAAGPVATLWAPTERPRLQLYALGLFYDGWLADRGRISLWPDNPARPLAGWLSMRLSSPAEIGPRTIAFRLPGGIRTGIRVAPGHPQDVHIAVCSDGRWTGSFRSDGRDLAGLRFVSVKATDPVFVPNASACPMPEPLA